ncbi:MAG: alpha/beta fold hydrolase [Chloroflexi bacterium]|nr:alpha/beta fold hydrolase [Chloroflexota bacterium]
MTINEKMIDVEGSPVHYFESGEANGRTLLLLSGGIGDAWSNWSAIIEPLAEEYHIFAPDLPGFSGSAALADMSIDGLLHWLQATLDALDQTDVVIVAHSISAILARMFATRSPEYVPALILSNGGTFPTVPVFMPSLMNLPLVGGLIFKVFGRIACGRKSLERLIYTPDALTDDLMQAWHGNATGFMHLIHAMLRYHFPKQQTPLVPTLLLWGVDDSMMTMAHAERLTREIPGAELVPITECGHLPSVETSDVFAFQVKSFLDQLSRPTLPTLHGVRMLQPIEG